MRVFSILLLVSGLAVHAEQGDFLVCAINERAGTISFFSPDNRLLKQLPVGKRPRGIHASPDGRTLFVAVSGSPI